MGLKDLRERKQMTLEEVGKVIGMSGGSYGAYEAGKRTLTIAYAVELAKLFEVNILDLFEITGASGKWTVIDNDGLPKNDGLYNVSVRAKKFSCSHVHDITILTEEGEAVYPCYDTSFCQYDCQHKDKAFETFDYSMVCKFENGEFVTEDIEKTDNLIDAESFEIIAWMQEPKPCLV